MIRMFSYQTIFYAYAFSLALIAVLPINGPESGMNDVYVIDLRLDYLLHAAIFIPLLFLVRRAFSPKNITGASMHPAPPSSFQLSLVLRKLYFVLPLALVFAAFCEFIQFPLTYRAFNLNDLLANMVGVVIGLPGWMRG